MNFKGIGFKSHQKVIPTLLTCLHKVFFSWGHLNFFSLKLKPQSHQSPEDTFKNSKNQDENFQAKYNKLIKKYHKTIIFNAINLSVSENWASKCCHVSHQKKKNIQKCKLIPVFDLFFKFFISICFSEAIWRVTWDLLADKKRRI